MAKKKLLREIEPQSHNDLRAALPDQVEIAIEEARTAFDVCRFEGVIASFLIFGKNFKQHSVESKTSPSLIFNQITGPTTPRPHDAQISECSWCRHSWSLISSGKGATNTSLLLWYARQLISTS